MTYFHQSVFVEFPILVAMSAEPLPLLVVVFVAKSNGNAILGMSPDLLDEAIVAFYTPLFLKKRGNIIPSNLGIEIDCAIQYPSCTPF
jgi:hypothetical protein